MSAGDEAIIDFTPPAHIRGAELAVAGCAMSSARVAEILGDIVRPEHFRDHPASLIFAAALALAEAGKPVDGVTVAAELTRSGNLAVASQSLPACLRAGMAADPRWHAGEVRKDFMRRRAGEALATSLGYVRGEAFDPETGFERVRELMDTALSPAQMAADLPTMGELFTEVVDDLENGTPRGLPTPWADVNEVIGGMTAGETLIVAGRTGSAKSMAVLGIAAHTAIRGNVPVLLSTMEMNRREIMTRLIAAEGRVPLNRLMHRKLDDGDWKRVNAVRQDITDSPLVIDDNSECSLAHIRARLRGMARTNPAGLLVVDYIGLMDGPQAENRQQMVSAMSRGLKLLAGEFAIPVIIVAQLNRMPEHRSDKRPQASDLRESGSLENDASVVLLLHRPDLTEIETPRAGEIDFIIDKNRHGPRCTVTECFQGHYARIVDMAPVAWSSSRHAEPEAA